MGDTSRRTSMRPSSRNHLNDFVWTSTRLGSSRLKREREKDIRVFFPSFCSFTLTIKSITPFNEIFTEWTKSAYFIGSCHIRVAICAQKNALLAIIMQFTIISLKKRLVKRFFIKNLKFDKNLCLFYKRHSVNVKNLLPEHIIIYKIIHFRCIY